ncbi:MAG: hypothetical protein ACK559_32280, partial [bacterium]
VGGQAAEAGAGGARALRPGERDRIDLGPALAVLHRDPRGERIIVGARAEPRPRGVGIAHLHTPGEARGVLRSPRRPELRGLGGAGGGSGQRARVGGGAAVA